MTGEGKSKFYKQVSHGATLIFDDVFFLLQELSLIFLSSEDDLGETRRY